MIHEALRKVRQVLPAIFAIGLLYLFYAVIGIGCPIRFLTGISCPGCGMTRAWLSVLHLDFSDAFHFHLLYPIPAIAAIVLLFQSRLPKTIYHALAVAAIAAFLLVYFYRLFDPDDAIVVFHPQDGFVFQLISRIFKT